jgi:hypothetical protein
MADWNVVLSDGSTHEEVLEYKSVKIPLMIRELSWAEKNKILTACFTYKNNGEVSFDFDRYMKDSLCKMIAKAPWGETTHLFLSGITSQFGNMLQALVPKAFEDNKVPDFFESEQKQS